MLTEENPRNLDRLRRLDNSSKGDSGPSGPVGPFGPSAKARVTGPGIPRGGAFGCQRAYGEVTPWRRDAAARCPTREMR